jgi:hypothetical protein
MKRERGGCSVEISSSKVAAPRDDISSGGAAFDKYGVDSEDTVAHCRGINIHPNGSHPGLQCLLCHLFVRQKSGEASFREVESCITCAKLWHGYSPSSIRRTYTVVTVDSTTGYLVYILLSTRIGIYCELVPSSVDLAYSKKPAYFDFNQVGVSS